MKKMSPLWNIPRERLVDLVSSSTSLSQVMKKIDPNIAGGSYKTIRKILDFHNIDYSKFTRGVHHNLGRKFKRESVPLLSVLTKNSSYSRGHLKKRLIKEGFLKEKCAICNMGKIWHGKKLVFILDHINGINNDNEIENLRLICPNCNSQLETHCRGFKGKPRCVACGEEKKKHSGIYCKKCATIIRLKKRIKKSNRPSYCDLILEIKKSNYCAVGRKYGVSDNAIRKWLGVYEKYNMTTS